jgi:hypothetical protein
VDGVLPPGVDGSGVAAVVDAVQAVSVLGGVVGLVVGVVVAGAADEFIMKYAAAISNTKIIAIYGAFIFTKDYIID